MTRLSSLAILASLSIAIAAPAFAGPLSIQKGESVCKAAASQQQPTPKSVRVDKDETRVNSEVLKFTLRVKAADDTSAKLICAVDRTSKAATLTVAD
jgi:hypothetical protein